MRCPDCGDRDWEIVLSKPKKAERHPQERPGWLGRLAVCFALLCVALPVIGTVGYTLSQTVGGFGAGMAVVGSTAVLITLILVIEGFGSSGKTGALRCKGCGFEQRAPVGAR